MESAMPRKLNPWTPAAAPKADQVLDPNAQVPKAPRKK